VKLSTVGCQVRYKATAGSVPVCIRGLRGTALTHVQQYGTHMLHCVHKKERAAVIKQAMAYESDESSEEEEHVAYTTFTKDKKKPPRKGAPLCFKTKAEQQGATVKDANGNRLCDVRGCNKVLTTSELASVAKVQL
jgi:hypothetical protein